MKFKNKGFTLIELLVVISIIGIITTLISANLNAARERGRDAQRKSDLYNIRIGLRLYYNDKMSFPASNASGEILGCGSSGTSTCTWGDTWTAGSTTYMNTLPKDPLPGQNYFYKRGVDDDESYTISACLENKSDDKGAVAESEIDCASGWMYQITQ